MQTSIFRNGQPLTVDERIDELKERLAELPKAGEHHIWEAFTLLETLSTCRQDSRDRRYFREAMDTGAYLEALLFLLSRARPALELQHLSFSGSLWSCRVAASDSDHSLCGAGMHPDRCAAILLALVSASCGRGARSLHA
jgi:hypothetical protein